MTDRMISMKTKTLFLSLLLALGATACGDDPGFAVNFAMLDGDGEIGCDSVLSAVGADAVDLQVADLRMYVSEVRLINAAGEEVPLAMDDVPGLQEDGIALLDFEDGCAETSTAETNRSVVGTAPSDEYTGVRFTVGIPESQNHLDPAAMDTPGPLAAGGMIWAWNVGYKFIRIDLAPMAAGGAPFNIHLGATGCMGDATAGESVTCANPNRMDVLLTGFDPASDTIAFDLRAALEGATTGSNTPETAPGCQSFPMDPECPAVFDNLGLPYAGTAPSGPQSVFRVR